MSGELAKEGKTIVKHSMVYGLGTILNRVIGFAMIPIYTRFLTPSDYGVLELLSLTTDVIGLVVSMGLATAMYRFYFEYEGEKERNTVISTAFTTFGTIALACLFSLSFTTGFLSRTLLDSESYASYFFITFTSLWFNTIVQMGYDYLRMRQRSTLYLLCSLFKLILALSLNIWFVVYLKYGVLGILLSTLISSIVTAFVLVVPILSRVGLHFSFSISRQLVRFGAPLIPSNLGAFIVHISDRYFLKYFGSLADTGIYSLGYKFGNLPNTFVTSPFMQIWQARRFELYKREDAEEIFSRIFTYFCFLITFVGLGISLVVKEVLEIVANPSFWEAYQIVPIIILSYTIFSFHYHFNMGILIKKKTKYLAYINGSNGVLNLILNLLLIRPWGIWGAAIATLISFLYKVTLTYLVSRRLFRVHFEFGRVGMIFLIAIGIYLLSTQITLEPLYLRLGLKSLLVFGFPLAVWTLKVLTPTEKDQMRAFVKEGVRRVSAAMQKG